MVLAYSPATRPSRITNQVRLELLRNRGISVTVMGVKELFRSCPKEDTEQSINCSIHHTIHVKRDKSITLNRICDVRREPPGRHQIKNTRRRGSHFCK
jgi:hypothetical protein